MSKTYPWKGGPVSIVIGKDKCLDIRATRPGDKPEHIFKTDELEDLFATLAASNMPVRNKHFVLMGKPEKAGERPAAIRPEITQVSRLQGGKEKEYPYAYVSEQLEEFEPKSFTIRSRPGYTGEPEPIFMAFATPWERSSGQTLQRVTGNAPESEPQLQRRKAK